MGVSEDERRLLADMHELLRRADMQNTARIYSSWPLERQRKYVEHMKRLAALDPDKYAMFSDLFAELTAKQLGA